MGVPSPQQASDLQREARHPPGLSRFEGLPAPSRDPARTTRAPGPVTVAPMPPKPPRHPTADGPKCQLTVDISARRRSKWDAEIASIAGRQHGLISLEQLRGLGIDRGAAHQRVRAGRLHPVHDGVYAVGFPTLTRDRQLMAAVLACGPDAALSHRSAAELWGLRPDERDSVDVTAPGRRGRSPRGIDAHRHSSLRASDVIRVRGIPCTNVERTLLDLAALVPIWGLRKAVAEAEVLRMLDHAKLRRLIQRNRGRRGVARLRLVLDELHPQVKRTRSELERRFLRMCVRADLPSPEVNASLEIDGRRLEPDFLWRDAGLIIEADGRRYHDTDSAFQLDRRREQRLQLAGWRVSRCTWEQVENESRRLAETIRGLLEQQNPRRRAEMSTDS